MAYMLLAHKEQGFKLKSVSLTGTQCLNRNNENCRNKNIY